MFTDETAERFEPADGKVLFVMALAAALNLAFVLPFVGGTLVDAATAAAVSLSPPLGKH